jgi:hypothetical protein
VGEVVGDGQVKKVGEYFDFFSRYCYIIGNEIK